jgi:signal peptide peptidase SppA
MHYAHIAARAFDRPLLLHPRSGQVFLTALARQIAVSPLDRRLGEDSDYHDGGPPPDRMASLPLGIARWDRDKAFPLVKNVAVLEVDGTLVNKNGSLGPDCGMTGYDGLRTQLMAALQDPEVGAIALYIDSPGGEVAGCFDLAELILGARALKPIWAIVDGLAASAAYALASCCTKITCSSVGMLGSIGVIVAHTDLSKMLDKEGVKVTLIYAGKHKADGNSFNPLAPETEATFQAEIDSLWDQFADLVARGRKTSPAAVKKLEAQTFLAPAALKLKLCDVVQSPAEALAELIETVA